MKQGNKMEKAYQYIVESDFFGQKVDVVIYEFEKRSSLKCVVVGTHVKPCPVLYATSLEEAKEVAKNIYYI